MWTNPAPRLLRPANVLLLCSLWPWPLAKVGGLADPRQGPAAQTASPQEPIRELAALLDECSQLDLNQDGQVELGDLSELSACAALQADAPLAVLVLVEGRLLDLSAQRPDDPLQAALVRWCADIAAERGTCRALRVDLPVGGQHQDGRYVLALRRLFRSLKAAYPDWQGALLLGHFPDAMLVRTCNWRLYGPLELRPPGPQERRFVEPVHYLRSYPEIVAHKADIVLADLDGNWEACYVQAETELPWSLAVFPGEVPSEGGAALDYAQGLVTYRDFFHVNDGHLASRARDAAQGRIPLNEEEPGELWFDPLDELANLEVSAADRQSPNPLALPEILISRLDARGSAFNPRPDLRAPDGSPQAGPALGGATDWHTSPWVPDAQLELDLLLTALARNHAYRSGKLQPAFLPASLAQGLPSGFESLRPASPLWCALDPNPAPGAGPDQGDSAAKNGAADGATNRPGAVAQPDGAGRAHAHGAASAVSQAAPVAVRLDVVDADLLDALVWLKTPAVLRTVRAHSDPWGAVFGAPDMTQLAAQAGAPWCFAWNAAEARFKPSLVPACAGGKLDWFLLRTLYEQRRMLGQPTASLYLHTGCEALSPPGASDWPYSHPLYGARNGAEALLFFADGLALIGRAKVFYDEPRGFAATLAAGQAFGETWRRYFQLEAAASDWAEVGEDIGRKRAYFWSLLGDWTLTLRAPQ